MVLNINTSNNNNVWSLNKKQLFTYINKTDCNEITEILLKEALSTINLKKHKPRVQLTQLCACVKSSPGYLTSCSVYVQWIEVWCDYSFYWYWWNCWLSLLWISYHKFVLLINEFNLPTYKLALWTCPSWFAWTHIRINLVGTWTTI